jgi:hypothetical protein
MSDEIIKQEQKHELSQGGVFSDMGLFKNLWNISCTFAKSELVPQNYRNKPEDCMVAVDMANRIGISPLMVMQNLYVVKEKLSEKGCKIIGEFSCSGEYSPLGLNFNCEGKLSYIGGREKGHPDEKDVQNARAFAKSLLNL